MILYVCIVFLHQKLEIVKKIIISSKLDINNLSPILLDINKNKGILLIM